MDSTLTPREPDLGRTLAGLSQATRRHERSTVTLDGWLLKADAEGATYTDIAKATGWDRRTVSRHLAKLKAADDYLSRLAIVLGQAITVDEGTHRGNA